MGTGLHIDRVMGILFTRAAVLLPAAAGTDRIPGGDPVGGVPCGQNVARMVTKSRRPMTS